MAEVATYTLEIDTDGDGAFDSSESLLGDVRGTRGIQTMRGRDSLQVLGPPRAGECAYELDNVAGTYSIGSEIDQGQITSLVATYSSTQYKLWRGLLDAVNQQPQIERQSVEVSALGSLAQLTARKGSSSAVYQSIDTGTALGHLLDAAGVPKNLAGWIADQSPAGYWPMGEASGDAIDGTANGNDGTVTIGAGARDATALDDGGDGCIEFDGAATKVQIADDAAIQNIFDGGGAVAFVFDADSDGEGDIGLIADKGWTINLGEESGGLVKFGFGQPFSGTTGLWASDTADIPLNSIAAGVIVYDADATSNDPTVYLYDLTNGYRVLTVGDGLTETSTPVGTRITDVGTNLIIGNNTGQTRTFDGHIDEIVLSASTWTAAQAGAYAARVLDAPRHLDTGDTTLAWWWLDSEEDVFEAMATLLRTEGPRAVVYEDGSGAIVFKNASARADESRSTSVQSTFRGTGTEPLFSDLISYSDGEGELVNSATLTRVSRAAPSLPAFRAAASASAAATTSVTVTKPSGTAEDDILIAIAAGETAAALNWTAPAGWTNVATEINTAAAAGNLEATVFWKRAGASEAANYAFTTDGTTGDLTAAILAYEGHALSGNVVEASDTDQSPSGTQHEAPSLTTLGPDRTLIALYASGDAATTWTAPADMTERVDTEANGCSVAVYDENIPAPTGTASKLATSSGTVVSVGFSLAIIQDQRTEFWSLGESLVLGNDAVTKLVARSASRDPAIDAVTPVEDTDYTVDAGSLASLTLNRDSGSVITLTITAGASGATLSGLRLRARLAAVLARVDIANDNDASASIATYGTRPLPDGYAVRGEIAVADMQALANTIVSDYKNPRAKAEFSVYGNRGSAAMTACLAREVSDRVRLIESRSSIDLTGYLEAVRHTVTDGGLLHRTDFAIQAVPS